MNDEGPITPERTLALVKELRAIGNRGRGSKGIAERMFSYARDLVNGVNRLEYTGCDERKNELTILFSWVGYLAQQEDETLRQCLWGMLVAIYTLGRIDQQHDIVKSWIVEDEKKTTKKRTKR